MFDLDVYECVRRCCRALVDFAMVVVLLVAIASVMLLGALLSGCAAPKPETLNIGCEPVFVDNPVPVKAKADSALRAPLTWTVPSWVDPVDPAASSCLKATDEQTLLDSMDTCLTRVRGWEAFDDSPLPAH